MASSIVLAGRNPLFLDLLTTVEDRQGVELGGVFCDDERDIDVVAWLRERGIEFASLSLLSDVESAATLIENWRSDFLINYNATILYPEELLHIPKCGCVNMHPGLLPEYAGLHTHQWAIRNGETQFGSTLHWMVPKVDAGDIIFRESFPLSERDTGLSVFMKCLRTGSQLVKMAIDYISEGRSLPSVRQDLARRHLYRNRDALDGTIDWSASDEAVIRFFRAANYAPFESPTYLPTAQWDGHDVILHKARPGRLVEARPGRVLSVRNGELEVVCGNNRTIVCRAKSDLPLGLVDGSEFQ